MSEAYTLITGATSGLGRSIAQKLASSQRLVLVGRNQERLDAVRVTCANSEQHLLWIQDLALSAGIAGTLKSFLASTGIKINHFIHCAGVREILAVCSVEMPDITRLFRVNVFSSVEIVQVLASRRVNGGMLRSITFISSIVTRAGMKGYSVYAASKGALNALTHSLAVELAPEVRVNAVLPGFIETEGTKQLFDNPDFKVSLQLDYPLGFGRPEDIANAVDFLCSDKARWITGQEFVVDGGRSVI